MNDEDIVKRLLAKAKDGVIVKIEPPPTERWEPPTHRMKINKKSSIDELFGETK